MSGQNWDTVYELARRGHYDPKQPRDKDGQWTDKLGGTHVNFATQLALTDIKDLAERVGRAPNKELPMKNFSHTEKVTARALIKEGGATVRMKPNGPHLAIVDKEQHARSKRPTVGQSGESVRHDMPSGDQGDLPPADRNPAYQAEVERIMAERKKRLAERQTAAKKIPDDDRSFVERLEERELMDRLPANSPNFKRSVDVISTISHHRNDSHEEQIDKVAKAFGVKMNALQRKALLIKMNRAAKETGSAGSPSRRSNAALATYMLNKLGIPF